MRGLSYASEAVSSLGLSNQSGKEAHMAVWQVAEATLNWSTTEHIMHLWDLTSGYKGCLLLGEQFIHQCFSVLASQRNWWIRCEGYSKKLETRSQSYQCILTRGKCRLRSAYPWNPSSVSYPLFPVSPAEINDQMHWRYGCSQKDLSALHMMQFI